MLHISHILPGQARYNVHIYAVKAHCGKIKGENIKGGGARFTVDLPLEEDEHEDQG